MFVARAIIRTSFLFAALIGIAACATRPTTADHATRLGESFVDDLGISGLAISVGRYDTIIWSAGFGLADTEQGVPISPSATKFRIGSVSKPMTAMAVAQLYEEGLLDLDAPVQQYVPYFPHKEKGSITTRQLAGHLAGVRGYAEGEYYNTRAYESVEAAISVFKDDPLESVPGSTHRYTSYGYNLISAVIEGSSGQGFLDYMSEQVFAPAEMSQTLADKVVPTIKNRARHYDMMDGTLVNAPWVDNSVKWAGGGFLSTSDDLVRFGLAHFSKYGLRPETVDLLWRSQKSASGEVTNYGIGWRIRIDRRGRRVVFHGGSAVGGAADFHVYPNEGLVVATLSNTSASSIPLEASHALIDDLADLFLDQDPASDPYRDKLLPN